MRKLIFANMILNTVFVLMALSEMLGITGVHEALPWYIKWWWICALAGGNLFIHTLMLKRLK
ncbi:MAG: hypothetical protein WCE79_23585 [Xanthobacteraceae bacterium]|jgi:hypothetical protein